MTKSTQSQSNLKAKILKIAKGLNEFTLPDILPILNKSEKVISDLLSELEAENLIKKISETEYLYTNIKKRQNKPVPSS